MGKQSASRGAAEQRGELSPVPRDDPGAEGRGGRLKEGAYGYKWLTHIVVQQKLTKLKQLYSNK